MKILLLDNDTDYSQRFKFYLEKKYSDFSISIFNSIESAKEMADNEKYDVVFFDAEYDKLDFSQFSPDEDSSVFAYMSGTNEIINDSTTVYKYRTISELYNTICEMYEKKKKRVVRTNVSSDVTENDRTVITFIPAHGGSGSSTMAAACAVALAGETSVLYINLEQCPSDTAFFRYPGQKCVTDIVSALKTKYTETGIYQLLKEVIVKEGTYPGTELYCLKGFNNIMDWMALTPQGIRTLIKIIREKFSYKYIIVDIDYIMSSVMNTVITSSDQLVVVSSGSEVAQIKLKKILRYLDVLGRDESNKMPDQFVLFNQYYGSDSKTSGVGNMRVVSEIPRFRTDDMKHITSAQVIEQVLGKKDVFSVLKTVRSDQDPEKVNV